MNIPQSVVNYVRQERQKLNYWYDSIYAENERNIAERHCKLRTKIIKKDALERLKRAHSRASDPIYDQDLDVYYYVRA